MFEKLKQLKQLKDLQESLKKEKIEIEKEGVKVMVNGNMEVEEIRLNSALNKEQQEKVLKDCLNEAARKIQTSIIQRMSQMSGLGF